MDTLKIANPFGAPVYYEETVESTMSVSRQLALNGEPHGTVITAGFQQAGRGRIRGRAWLQERGANLPFTLLLRYPRIEDIPPALTLRIGVAVSLAIEDFSPSLKGRVMVKWPNDIMIGAKKTAGILCESDGTSVHAGIGINFAQKVFPQPIAQKATSIALAEGADIDPGKRFCLLEKILARIHSELEPVQKTDWNRRLEQRLYRKNEQVTFIHGAADSGKEVSGFLSGISENGELLITVGGEKCAFTTGELI